MNGYKKLTLVPVEVFGTEECCVHDGECPSKGYGLCDAVSAWSDCNRARGKIYRVDDDTNTRGTGESVEIFVNEEDLEFFNKEFGND